MIDDSIISGQLGYDQGVVHLDNVEIDNISNLKRYYVSEIIEKEFGINAVYFSGDYPTVYFKTVSSFDKNVLEQLSSIQKKIWNQGKVPFLIVESSDQIRVYNCFAKPINPNKEDESVSDLELISGSKTLSNDLEKLKNVVSRISIDSGSFWQLDVYSNKLSNRNRVNKSLIENLKQTRKELLLEGLSLDIIHDLLIRSLFLLYLEDRGATDASFYNNYSAGARSYFQILENLDATYNLFRKLETSFNGNLSPVTPQESQIINLSHLKKIKECFWDTIEKEGQLKLFDWRAFDFKFIPIELISEIYEEFLSQEQGDSQTSSDGAYYTPHSLVEFVLNKVLPWSDEHNNETSVKTLDPTCGSGIFLVEAFKRLVDRWEYNNPSKDVDFNVLQEIVQKNIFGVEKNEDAIKVAAFSIYLAMLDKLEPKTLWQTVSFPFLIYDPNISIEERQGHNLFLMSSLASGPFEEINFDLIVGNPPFKRGNLNQEGKSYLSDLDFAQEYVLAFLHRATTLSTCCQIALIATSKILFNVTSGYKNFRNFIFEKNYVSEVYNLSILRRVENRYGGNLFSSAVGPVCIFFYQNYSPAVESDHITYCAPKTAIKNNIIDGIVIDQTDIKYLPRKEILKSSWIWKVAMWGRLRDYRLIEQFDGDTLEDEFNKAEKEIAMAKGVGFQTSNPAVIEDFEISKVPFISARHLDRYYTLPQKTISISNTKFRRLGEKKAYKAPHVLIKEGQSSKQFCASYLDFDCSFNSTLFGITSSDSDYLKLLTAYLNSSFASYFLFLTTSTWGVERERVKPNELYKLPGIINISPEIKSRIVTLVDDIISLKKDDSLFVSQSTIQLEKEIDDLIYKSLNLSDEDILLINDLIKYDLDLFQSGSQSIAYKPVLENEMKNYCKELFKSLNSLLSNADINLSISYYTLLRNSPLSIVSVYFHTDKVNQLIRNESSEANLLELIATIDKFSYSKFSESIYFRKSIKFFSNDHIHIIKPNERRFWSSSYALNDADELVLDIVNRE